MDFERKTTAGGLAGGPATFAGTDMQASVAAFIAAHVLARQQLNWLELDVPDVPTAILGETRGPGDDIRVEFVATSIELEIQSKKGLRKDKRLDDTFRTIATRLPTIADTQVVIVVDSLSTSRTVRSDLKRDLKRIGDGRTDQLSEMGEYVSAIMIRGGASVQLLERVGIVTLDVAHKGEQDAARGVQMLRMILEDPAHAETAWDLLVRECEILCRDRRRFTFDKLAALLSRNGIKLKKAQPVGEGTLSSPIPANSSEQSAISSAEAPTPKSPDPKVAAIQAMLDGAKGLLERGDNTGALAILADVQKRTKRTTLPPEVLASLHSRLGATQMRLGKWKEARSSLVRALQHDENHTGALVNLSIIEAREGRLNDAMALLDRAIAVNGESAAAWASRTALATKLGVENRPPTILEENPEYLSGIANTAMVEGNWPLALEFSKRALRFGRTNDRLMIYGIALYNDSYDARITEELPSPARAAALREVIAIATEVIDELGDGLPSNKRVDALVLRASAHRSTGDLAMASKDLLDALEADRGNLEAAYQLAIVRAKQDDWQGVLAAAETLSLGETGGRGRLMVMKARALLVLNREGEIEKVLAEALEAAKGTAQETEVRINGADIAIEAGILAVASALVAGVSDSNDAWLVEFWKARIATKEGRHDEAERDFMRAAGLAQSPADKRVVTAEFAIYLSRRGEQPRAIPFFQAVDVESPDARPEWVATYLRALYEADELTRVDAFIEVLRSRGPLPASALQIDWWIGSRQEDLNRQVKALEGLRRADESNTGVMIYLADGYLKQGRTEESARLVTLAARQDEITPVQLVQLADVSARLGHGEQSIRFAYEALRRDPDNPAVNMAYVNSMLRAEQQSLKFQVDSVGPDTAVTLSGVRKYSGEEYTYVILDRTDLDVRRNEFQPGANQIADLLGKKLGEEIVRRKGAPSEEKLIVKEIKHIYIHALHDVMLNFPRRFPENTALQQFKIGDTGSLDDLAPIIQSTASRAEQVEAAIKLHTEQGLPISAIAAALGADLPSLMDTLTLTPNRRLNVERGGLTQMDASVEAARLGDSAVLTRSALYTAQELDLLTVLTNTHKRLLVPNTLVDEVQAELRGLYPGREAGLSHVVAAAEGAGFRFIDTPAEQVRVRIRKRELLLEWLASHSNALPRPIASLRKEREEFREMLGASAYDALALASIEDAAVYADDVGLRELAVNDYGVGGFSTFALMAVAAEKQVLSGEERDDVIVKLIERNHYFIPLRAELLIHVLTRNNFSVNGQVLRVLDRLADPDLVVALGVEVVAEVLRLLSTSLTRGTTTLASVTAAALEALTRSRDVIKIARDVEAAVSKRMGLLPIQLNEILNALRAFVRSRLGLGPV